MTASTPLPISPAVPLTALSEREQAVLRLLSQGYTNKEIARKLTLSQNVVEKILGNSSPYAVYPKIGVTNAKSAIAWYLQQVEDARKIETAPAAQLAPLQIPAAASTPGPDDLSEGGMQAVRKSQGASLFLAVFITTYVALVALVFIPIWLQGGTGIVFIEWGNAYAVLPLMAGIYGLRRLPKLRPGISPGIWRGLRLLSAGLLFWATGSVIAISYSLVTESVTPYPSLADVCYVAQDICFAAAFLLWWRKSCRRGEARRWLWLVIAAPALIGHLVLQYSVRDLGPILHITPALPALELSYSALESACLGIAICLLVPMLSRAPAIEPRAAFRFISGGMVIFFLAGLSYVATVNLPEGHWLKFSNGNGVDLLFATAFLLIGIGVTLAARAAEAEAPFGEYASFVRWGPAVIGLAALGLAAAPAMAYLSLGNAQDARGEVQILGETGQRIRVEADGRVLSTGETLPAYTPIRIVFQVVNNGMGPITLHALTIGVRGPGVTCHDKNTIRWAAPDVPFPAVTDLTLQPGQTYEYRGTRALYLPGTYFLEPVQQGTDGKWGGVPPFTCVDLTVGPTR